MSGGGVPLGHIVPGSVPERVHGGKESSPTPGNHMPSDGFEAKGTGFTRAVRRTPHILHGKQHHPRRPMRKSNALY